MANVLFLAHRLPYPPNKGDKVRSYHLLKHLVARHKVYLGTFLDDPDDAQYLPAVRAMCVEMHVERLHPIRARFKSLTGLLHGEPLTLRYYRSAALAKWATDLCSRGAVDCTLVFSSSMAQFADPGGGKRVVDFVDVDSAKWGEYALSRSWPLSWLYRREGRELLAYERDVAANSDQSFFATEKEAALFRRLAPESATHVAALGNGVDAEYFAPKSGRASPFDANEVPVVFTGAMDYWPNVDAVRWFAGEMLPTLRTRWPNVRLHIVGRSPATAVRQLAGQAVSVTGTVPDVRPYLQHAAVVIAPLRLARGIQNKVLEAMAMGRPVVAAAACVDAIDAVPDEHVVAAVSAQDFIDQIDRLLGDPVRAGAIGASGRERVRSVYGWDARLATLDSHLITAPRVAT